MQSKFFVKAVICATALALVSAGCSRSDSGPDNAGTTGGGGKTATASGAFGSLTDICGPGNAKGATARGVTDTEIRVGTVADPGFSGRPGLNQELFDSATVFTKWCNAAGGIAGRQIKVDLLDAKLTEYRARILEACQNDFSLVGGGAVFDDVGQKDRLECLLPDIAGFVVSTQARGADLMVQVVPNPLDTLPVGDYKWLAEKFPDSVNKVGALTGSLPSTILVKDQAIEGAESQGMKVIYDAQYNAAGEPTWAPIAQTIKSKGIKGILWTGEPENLAKLEIGLADIGYKLDWIRADANHYDQKLQVTGGGSIANTYVRSTVFPFEQASENPATQQYLDLYKKYLPSAKAKTYLGVQAFSAWMLFAKSVKACGNQVTAKCLLSESKRIGSTTWTGGGLHAAMNIRDQKSTECFSLLLASPKGFTLADIGANDSIFNCTEGNILTLKGDYGKGTKLADVGKSMSDLK
ncbi:MAG: ABC transporter substrate-binding protein [Actinomycetes bacterium]